MSTSGIWFLSFIIWCSISIFLSNMWLLLTLDIPTIFSSNMSQFICVCFTSKESFFRPYTRRSTTIIRRTFNTKIWSPLIKPCTQIRSTLNNEWSLKVLRIIILDKEQPLKRFVHKIFSPKTLRHQYIGPIYHLYDA